ncbi:hypothetical protein [Gluconobacter sp. DsW_056]|uniref:hypothetical protein n=1 Tax=Gluconobacter sp. DsW_056 TaxID=1511209 RepID=UPI0018EA2B26|nr:hypothetical protein [Gluconobacter sp. DsW_056]
MLVFHGTVDPSYLEARRDPRHFAAHGERRAPAGAVVVRWQWLQNARRTTPSWIASHKFWEIPKAWFDDFVNRALQKYGRLYVIQPYREQEICSPSCQNAKGHECQCSCMGVHHGAGSDGSCFEVSDAFSTRWGERELACRLMVAKTRVQ